MASKQLKDKLKYYISSSNMQKSVTNWSIFSSDCFNRFCFHISITHFVIAFFNDVSDVRVYVQWNVIANVFILRTFLHNYRFTFWGTLSIDLKMIVRKICKYYGEVKWRSVFIRIITKFSFLFTISVSYTHLRAHET